MLAAILCTGTQNQPILRSHIAYSNVGHFIALFSSILESIFNHFDLCVIQFYMHNVYYECFHKLFYMSSHKVTMNESHNSVSH